MTNAEQRNKEVRTTYGAHQLARDVDLPELDGWAWDIPGAGPGVEVFGGLKGLRALDLGSGLGRQAAFLASLGAKVTALEAAPTQHQRALARYPATPGLRLICADAATHLQRADPYDLIYSIGGVPFMDPNRLLRALSNALRPGGRLLFSALHTNSAGPSSTVAPRPEILRLPGTTEDHTVHMWVLKPQLWEDLIVAHGLTVETVSTIDCLDAGQPLSYRLYTARRPVREGEHLRPLPRGRRPGSEQPW
ncbi:class I SAM-dependent methyltransferase [Streptomyces sp. NPDC047971]|uniref:class I SAM-dependent methyltransferase n=1 Tax=Streptomyces sp. NPDC047971 TaxID=3154499 RepID=UPI0033E3A128